MRQCSCKEKKKAISFSKRNRKVYLSLIDRKIIGMFLLLFFGSLFCSAIMAIKPGDKVWVYFQEGANTNGPLEYTMNAGANGLEESLQFAGSARNEQTVYAFLPYNANVNDPKHVSLPSGLDYQTQDGAADYLSSKYLFYISPSKTFDVGYSPTIDFTPTFIYFDVSISTNVDGLEVQRIVLENMEGTTISYETAEMDITVNSSLSPDFQKPIVLSGGSSSITLDINDGLPIKNISDQEDQQLNEKLETNGYLEPEDRLKTSHAYIAFLPFRGKNEKLEITVTTNQGDFTYEFIANEYYGDDQMYEDQKLGYRYGTVVNIPLRIKFPEPEVEMQWSVSQTDTDPASFVDVANDETTTMKKPGPAYLQIRPEVENLDYDNWGIDYTVTPSDYIYPVTTPIDGAIRYDFNEGNPHTAVGTYVYTVTAVRFYDDQNSELYSKTFDEPYTHTIQITDDQQPLPDIKVNLQWSVSTTSDQQAAFSDVGNYTTTSVNTPTPVYLRIRPIVEGSVDFDRWEMEYTAEPENYKYLMNPLTGTSPYDFNQGNPHTRKAEYVYTVRSVVLYKGGQIVWDEWVNYQHTIIIQEDEPGPPDTPDPTPDPVWPPVLPPDPTPDPNTDGWIIVKPVAPLCYAEWEFLIGFDRNNTTDSLFYSIAFTDAAIAAGFENDSIYKALPEDGIIPVSVSGSISKGIYYGYVVVWSKEAQELDMFPFRVEVKEYIRIAEQPVDIIGRCEGDGFILSVKVDGEALSYQWYRNDVLIPGATEDSYQSIMSDQTTGFYYVEVEGYCNTIFSDTVNVTMATLQIEIKWTDVLYIRNTDNRYTSFQWYKDGQPVSQHGTSIYYTDPNGLLGSYSVRAYKTDGTYDESCPVSFSTVTKASEMSLYPNPVESNTSFTVQGKELSGSWIEVYDFYGRLNSRRQSIADTIDMVAPTVGGMYFVKIITPDGRITTLKLLVKE